MNPRVLINTAAFVAGAYMGISAAKKVIEIREVERAKREQYEKDVQREIILIHRANAVVQDRIRTGQYSGMSINEIMERQELEKMEQNLAISHHEL